MRAYAEVIDEIDAGDEAEEAAVLHHDGNIILAEQRQQVADRRIGGNGLKPRHHHVLHRAIEAMGGLDKLMERLEKGGQYYRELLSKTLKRILVHRGMVEQFSQTKKYIEGLDGIEEGILKKYLEISKVGRLIQAILKGDVPGKMDDLEMQVKSLRLQFLEIAKEKASEKIKEIKSKTGRKKASSAKPKRKKGDTHEVTFELHKAGKSIEEIAKERILAESTIKSHLAQGIELGRIELEDCLPQGVISEINSQLDKFKDMASLREHFEGKFDYGTVKMVIAGRKV